MTINFDMLFELEIQIEIYHLKGNELNANIEFFNKALNLGDVELTKLLLTTCTCVECQQQFKISIDHYKQVVLEKQHLETMEPNYLELKAMQEYVCDQIKRLNGEIRIIHDKHAELVLTYQKLMENK